MSTLPIVLLRRRQDFWQKSQETARELRREAHTIDPERPQRGIGRAAHNLLQLMQQVEHPTAETNQQQEFYKLYGTYRDWIAAVTAEKTARDSNRRLSPKDHEKLLVCILHSTTRCAKFLTAGALLSRQLTQCNF